MKKLSYIFILLLSAFVILVYSCSSDSKAPGNMGGSGSSGGSTGKGGSYARFAIVANYLYVLTNNSVVVYDISNPDSMIIKSTTAIAGTNSSLNAETIFVYEDYLLFGTQFGMIVYSLQNPESPSYEGRYNHIIGCDPVVAEDGFAYLTLNGATGCRGSINSLDILSLYNPINPTLIKTVNMVSPRGLGIDNRILFVCDADKVKVINVKTPSAPYEISEINVKGPYDVIPYNKNLIISATEGVFQYDYSDSADLKFNSKIPVVK
ncbi:MAG: hypothetical protein LC109_00640 [Bacteroidia bacterium]|nr:hypothetical protein [Bacteroidia bacterium]